GVVGDAAQADLAVRPRLPAGPFDAIEQVLGLARRPVLDVAGRTTAAARIDAQADIAVRHPLLGVADLPTLVFVGRARGYARVLLLHALPGGLIAVLEVQPLAIGAATEDDGVAPLAVRPEHVAAQHQPVVHRDRHGPIDPRPIANFADLTVTHGFLRKSRDRWCDPAPVSAHNRAAHSVRPPPPCGEGLGVGVARLAHRSCPTRYPPPHP